MWQSYTQPTAAAVLPHSTGRPTKNGGLFNCFWLPHLFVQSRMKHPAAATRSVVSGKLYRPKVSNLPPTEYNAE